jgi:hypothetical protein
MNNICERCGGAKLAWDKTWAVPGGPWTEVVGNIQTVISDHTTPAPTSAGYTPSILKLCNCLPEQPKQANNEQAEAKWHIVPEETHCGAVTFTNKESEIKLKAMTKWDGCTNLWLTEVINGSEEECYHHICDLDKFIAALQDVREKARSYFYGDFSVAPVDDEEILPKIAAFQKEEQEVCISTAPDPTTYLIPRGTHVVGDGATDDTVAIQRAFDATHQEQGRQSGRLSTYPRLTYTGLEIVGSGDEEHNA